MGTDKEALTIRIEQGKKQLAGLSGHERLVYLLRLNPLHIAKFHSLAAAEELLDGNLDLIENTNTEDAAKLMVIKAYLSSWKVNLDEARIIVDKAIVKSRAVNSKQVEAMALGIKGYHKDAERQHEKAAAYYLMALENIPKLHRAELLRELGTSYSEQGKYGRAWYYLNEAVKQTEGLIIDQETSPEEKNNQLEIQADTWSRLATILEVIDDIYGAEAAHDKSISMARENGFTWGLYKALSRKIKLYLIKKDFGSAENCLKEAEELNPGDYDPKALYLIAHDWARLYRFTQDYEKAMDKYEEILYGPSSNKEEMDAHTLVVMKNMAMLFNEVKTEIYECLINTGKVSLGKTLRSSADEYESVLMDSAVYKEVDKKARLTMQEQNIIDILHIIFQKVPLSRRFKHVAIYFQFDTKTATYVIGEKGARFSERAFLTLKYLIDNPNKCASREEIKKEWEKQGIFVDERGSSSVIREVINRDVRDKLGLKQFIITCPRGAGWKLID